jgi:hypothetical protein
MVYICTAEFSQELTGFTRQTTEETALTFAYYGVEYERTFSRTGRSCHSRPVAQGDVEIDAGKIVISGTAQFDVSHRILALGLWFWVRSLWFFYTWSFIYI